MKEYKPFKPINTQIDVEINSKFDYRKKKRHKI